MAMKIHNIKFAIIHALVTLKQEYQRLDGTIDKNRTYQLRRDFLLKRLENLGLSK